MFECCPSRFPSFPCFFSPQPRAKNRETDSVCNRDSSTDDINFSSRPLVGAQLSLPFGGWTGYRRGSLALDRFGRPALGNLYASFSFSHFYPWPFSRRPPLTPFCFSRLCRSHSSVVFLSLFLLSSSETSRFRFRRFVICLQRLSKFR